MVAVMEMSNYNKDIYRMYEEEFNKVKKLNKDNSQS